MIGDEASQAEIVKTWEDHHCLAIEGRLTPGEDNRSVLRVGRTIGPCHGNDE